MLIALIALLAAPAASANAPFVETKGTVGFEFGFPLGGSQPVGQGSTIGFDYFMADNMAARATFGLDAVLSPSGTPALFNFGLALRMYQLRRNNVAVFLQPAVVLAREVLPAAVDATVGLTFAAGVGAEYFFADHFSVGGVLSAGLSFRNIGGPAGSSVRTGLSTNTSGLFAAVYF